MKPVLKLHFAGSLFLISLLFSHNCESQSSGWYKQSRLYAGILHDSNVLEAADNPRGTGAFQSAYFFNAVRRNPRGPRFLFSYQGGLKFYENHGDENRTAHRIGGAVSFRLHRKLSLTLHAYSRFKLYFTTRQGFSRLRVSPEFNWKITGPISLSPFVSYESIDYNGSKRYDYAVIAAGISFRSRISRNATIALRIATGKQTYNRYALTYSETDFWKTLSSFQQDKFFEVSSDIEFYSWALCRLSAGIRSQKSNSFGYSFYQPLLNFSAARDIGAGIIMTIYGSFRVRYYRDDLDPDLHTRPGSEAEENTYLLLDIAKPLTTSLMVNVRAGRYLDESPIADVYYKKNLLSVGISKKF